MNVRTLCLSILYTRDASGYEIRKLCTEGECSYFVEASFGSIYPALAKLEDEGLVTSRVEQQKGRPAKKIYAITAAGRAAFIDALHDPLGEEVLRSPFLLFARFAHLLDADLVRTRVEEMLERMDTELAELRKLKDDLNEAGHDDQILANDSWVMNYGISCLEVAREHLHTHMDDLIASARQNGTDLRAAE